MDEKNFKLYNLSQDILKALEKLQYNSPTKVQEEVIPFALRGRDIIVKSQTGSGKTAAFAIPICEKIDIDIKDPEALILAPTRELSVQIKEDITNVGRFKKIRCAAVFGKQPITTQVAELKQRVHVVAGTPGRVIDHIERGSLVVDNIKYLIIDEADKMLNMGFIEQVETIINALPKSRITMLFSATLPEEIEILCKRYMTSPERLEITPENITSENIKQELYVIDENEKFNLLNKLIYIKDPGSCIIFCRTKENVDTIYEKMKKVGHSCYALHGGMLQNDRLEIMQRFKRGEFVFLVATDVAARGIDVESITHIINYDIPVEDESYVHRIGRTGRAGSSGEAITLMNPYEKKYLESIEKYVGYEIPRGQIPTQEELEKAKANYNKRGRRKPVIKKDKAANLNTEITKIYINAGKKKKISAGDIVGAIAGIDGMNAEDIGIITIGDNFSHIDILNGKGKLVLERLPDNTIKGKTVRVEKAEK